eukprot:GHVL01012227.1.p1 GENE.GHVL01012227.1~~GHVL01012227.1.p1  ORF type:complete len:334 (+),score=62.89 GHVL01012227.1:104-1105(+)
MEEISKQFREYEKTEPLLNDDPMRLTVFPIMYPDIWAMYKKHEASFWTTEEIDLAQDILDWAKLSDQERHFIKYVLAFFAASDGIVLENLAAKFCEEVENLESRYFYTFQIAMENIHSETYSVMIDELIKDRKEKDSLFTAIESVDVVKKKAEWAIKWMRSDASFAERIVAYTCVEGILFSGSFCAIYWLKKRGLCPGLTFSNELISRDEGLHADFGCLIYSKLEKKLPEEFVHEIIKSAVEVEKLFICDSLPCSLVGMNADLMSEYIRFVADRLAVTLGYEKVWNATNPFEWMELISLQGKTNFFEKRVGEYQKAGVMTDRKNQVFALDAEF